MIFAWVVYNVLGNLLLVSKYSFVVVECGEVTVDHLGMVSYTNLTQTKHSNDVWEN